MPSRFVILKTPPFDTKNLENLSIEQLELLENKKKKGIAMRKQQIAKIDSALNQIRMERELQKLDADEKEGESSTSQEIEQFYNNIKPWIRKINFICSAGSPEDQEENRAKLFKAIDKVYEEVVASLKAEPSKSNCDEEYVPM